MSNCFLHRLSTNPVSVSPLPQFPSNLGFSVARQDRPACFLGSPHCRQSCQLSLVIWVTYHLAARFLNLEVWCCLLSWSFSLVSLLLLLIVQLLKLGSRRSRGKSVCSIALLVWKLSQYSDLRTYEANVKQVEFDKCCFWCLEITPPSLSIFACLTHLSGPDLVVTVSRKRAFTAQTWFRCVIALWSLLLVTCITLCCNCLFTSL